MEWNIVIAPSGFKEALEADQVAQCIARGIKRVMPNAHLKILPFVDGGEGFSRILCSLTHGFIQRQTVTGPMGDAVGAHFGFLGGTECKTAVLEMAAAAGLRLLPSDRRAATMTTTRGVGELIRAALDAGAEKIIVGCGDSGTNDAGAGAVQALGVRLLDDLDREIGFGGAELLRLKRIDVSARDARLQRAGCLEVACNWQNLLCGPFGVIKTYGPQKGATPSQVQVLEEAFEHYAAVIYRDLGVDVRTMPGGGASGGLGAGLHALLGAKLVPRYELVTGFLDFERQLATADLVITAEGKLDGLTSRGKVPAEIACHAKQAGVPVVVLAGEVSPDARGLLEDGIDAFDGILQAPCTLSAAIHNTSFMLEDAAEQVMRLVLIGSRIFYRGRVTPSGVMERRSLKGLPH